MNYTDKLSSRSQYEQIGQTSQEEVARFGEMVFVRLDCDEGNDGKGAPTPSGGASHEKRNSPGR